MRFLMKSCIALVLSLSLAAAMAGEAAANALTIKVDISSQTMRVYEHGVLRNVWKVSTGRRGYYTPHGQYRPKWLSRHHRSRKYNNAPMPYAIFFRGGYAIHGTNAVSRLGRPASHGCIRLAPSNAAQLFALVQRHGRHATAINIHG